MGVIILLIFITADFAGIAIFLLLNLNNLKKTLKERDEIQKRRIYEISILKAIQDRIGYSLDTQLVVETLTESLKNLFPYSTASSMIIKDDKILFKVIIEERVGSRFIEQVKKSMLASLSTVSGNPLPQRLDESRTGLAPDETNLSPLASFFHIPLVVSGSVVGMINVSSTRPGLYKEADMTILYQMASQASTALSKLNSVIKTEKGKLLAMIGSLEDGIFMVDTNFKLTVINDAAKRLLGVTASAPTFFDLMGPLSTSSDFTKKIQEAMATNKVKEEKEFSLREKIIQIIITPVGGEESEQSSEKVIGASVTLHDITLEKHLSDLHEDFTAKIVHELRSPLTAIRASSELLRTEKEKLDEFQKEKMLDIIHKQSIQMIGEINSLLDASKMESGHFSVKQKPANISEVIADSIDLFRAEAANKQIILSSDIEENIPVGYFDPMRIGEVINNLISNSLKFTPNNGSITVSARIYKTEHLPNTHTNPGLLVSVSDTGIGIEKDKQSYLFSKFSQVENNQVTLTSPGSGLGLYIAKGIIEAHGGSIYVNSHPNQGTTIAFTLPISPVNMQNQTIQTQRMVN